jgi:hypothetical protein
MHEHVVANLEVVFGVVGYHFEDRHHLGEEFLLVKMTHHEVILVHASELHNGIEGTVGYMMVGNTTSIYHIREAYQKQVFVVAAYIYQAVQLCQLVDELKALNRIGAAVE